MKPDCIVLEANVFIALLLFKKLDELIKWRNDEHVEIFTCKLILGQKVRRRDMI